MSSPPLPQSSKCISAEHREADRLSALERELVLLRQAVQLLGLSPCSRCGRYFVASNRSARFDWKESICLDCLEAWWIQLRERLPVRDREVVERRLVQWLVTYHGGKVIQRLPQLGDLESTLLRFVAGCAQCDGTGQSGGYRCRSCDGRGTVWVVVPGLKGKQEGNSERPDDYANPAAGTEDGHD